MVAWGDVRTKLRGDLWRTASGIPDDVCDRWLHTSLREIEGKRRWHWLEDIQAAVEADAEAAFVAMPAGYDQVTSLAYRGTGDDYELVTPAPLQVVRARAANTSPGFPTQYARGRIDGGAEVLLLDTVVAEGSLFELIGSIRTPLDMTAAIAAAADNVTLQRETQAVLSLACHYVALNYLKDETNAARHAGAFARHEERLFEDEDAYRSDQTGGCIQPDTYYHDAAFGTRRA